MNEKHEEITTTTQSKINKILDHSEEIGAINDALKKLSSGEYKNLCFIRGRESDGVTDTDILLRLQTPDGLRKLDRGFDSVFANFISSYKRGMFLFDKQFTDQYPLQRKEFGESLCLRRSFFFESFYLFDSSPGKFISESINKRIDDNIFSLLCDVLNNDMSNILKDFEQYLKEKRVEEIKKAQDALNDLIDNP